MSKSYNNMCFDYSTWIPSPDLQRAEIINIRLRIIDDVLSRCWENSILWQGGGLLAIQQRLPDSSFHWHLDDSFPTKIEFVLFIKIWHELKFHLLFCHARKFISRKVEKHSKNLRDSLLLTTIDSTHHAILNLLYYPVDIDWH